MAEMKVSVVMPAYNAAQYIEQSVKALLKQTLCDFEIIVVDDCSTDASWTILKALSSQDKRLRVFRLQENSGSAKYPRDYAVSQALSPWICWIDSDDIVPDDYLERLCIRQQETQADIVCSTMQAFSTVAPCLYLLPRADFDMKQVVSGDKAVMWTVGVKWAINLNGCLVRKSIWESSIHYLNRDVLHMNADDYAGRDMLLQAERVAFSPVRYHYRCHEESITKAISSKLFEPLITDEMTVQLFEKRFGKDSAEVKEAWHQYFCHWVSMSRIYVVKKANFTDDNYRRAYSLLRSHHGSFPLVKVMRDERLPAVAKTLLAVPLSVALWLVKLINKA